MRVEEAFKNLKGDLAVRPIFHQLEDFLKEIASIRAGDWKVVPLPNEWSP